MLVSVDCFLRARMACEALRQEVEDGKLVFGKDICLRFGIDVAPDVIKGARKGYWLTCESSPLSALRARSRAR